MKVLKKKNKFLKTQHKKSRFSKVKAGFFYAPFLLKIYSNIKTIINIYNRTPALQYKHNKTFYKQIIA